MFDQTCFNRLATHFNISMFGHQTMFDDVSGRQTLLVWTGLIQAPMQNLLKV